MSEIIEAVESKFIQTVPIRHSSGSSHTIPLGRVVEPPIDGEIVSLVHQLFLHDRNPPLHTVMFGGLQHGSGCTRIAAATATYLAKSAGSVCLVEANLHSPSLAADFGLPANAGFSESLSSDEPIGAFVQPVTEGLSVLPAGFASPGLSLLLGAEKVRYRLAELRAEFNYVLIDSCPLDYVESLMLAHLTDGVVMVLEAERTRRDDAVNVAARLRSAGIDILCAVLNKRRTPIPSQLHEWL